MRRGINAASSPAPTGPAASNSSMLSILKCCLNPRVLVGMAVVIGGIALLAPGLLHSVVPYLLYLICPLSMLLMMFAMNRGGGMMGDGTAAPLHADQSAAFAEMQRQLRAMESRYLDLKAEHSGSTEQALGSEARVEPERQPQHEER